MINLLWGGLFFGGLVVGAGSAYFFIRIKMSSKIEILTSQLSEKEKVFAELKSKSEIKENENLSLLKEHLVLKTTLEEERKNTAEKFKLLQNAEAKLSDAFKALSSETLKNNNQAFLDLAQETLKRFHQGAVGDLEKRQSSIQEVVRPVRESLEKMDLKINELEKARAGAYHGIKEQIQSLLETQKHLKDETSNLVKALRSPVVRGRWGEIQLKRVVEMAGMLDHCDFYEQSSVETETGRLRPDLIVRLPGQKAIVIDAKAPLSAYLESVEAKDDNVRDQKLQEHAAHIRKHIRELSRKSYWDQFEPTPEFVVLFLPGETFFSSALEKDPSLIEVGVEQKVILATPTTLIALLRAVAYGWKQESLTKNADKISELGKELYKRLSDLGSHFSKLGKNLGQTVDAYNRSVGTLETRVLVSARKFHEYNGGSESTEIEFIEKLDQRPRPLEKLDF